MLQAGVQGRDARPLGSREADEAQGGVRGGVEQLALQRVYAAAQYLGLRRIELAGQPLEAGVVRGLEIDLNRLRDSALLHYM